MKGFKRIMAVGICLMIVAGCYMNPACAVHASIASDSGIPKGKTIQLNQAKALALANSSEYTSLSNKLALAEIQYAQSVKALQLQQKNQSTFRWSPLLNLKFPEDPTLADEFSYIYEPMEMQSGIDTIKHQMANDKYNVYEESTLLFTQCYTLQESIRFTENRLAEEQETLAKNQARLLSGQATQSDIDKIESSIKNLNTKLNNDMRSFETAKDKLSNVIGLDVRTGYTFSNPYITADMNRFQYENILNHTFENDEALYEAKVDTANALLALDTNYNLMRNQYGSDLDLINSFIQQIRNGEKVDSAAFRLKYDELLNKVDAPWAGHFRILFIKIPKEWIKGEVDGVRYVDDEPYVLYEAALEYQDVYFEEQQLRAELEEQVKDGFDNYISMRATYESLATEVEQKAEELEKAAGLNLTGEMTYEELADLQQEYADLQMEELTALSDYSSALTSYDKLTCGAITALLEGEGTNMDGSTGGLSYIVAEEEEGAYYYIHSLAVDNAFEFGLYIPKNFGATITSYELWVNGTQIGERTPADQSIKHLALTFDTVESATVRLYNGETFVDECNIDTSVYSGKLTITTGYSIQNDAGTKIGTYEISTSQTTGFTNLAIKTTHSEIAYYDIKTSSGTYLSNRRHVSIGSKFKYLGLLTQEIPNVTVCFYDEDKELLYECRVDVQNKALIQIEEVGE